MIGHIPVDSRARRAGPRFIVERESTYELQGNVFLCEQDDPSFQARARGLHRAGRRPVRWLRRAPGDEPLGTALGAIVNGNVLSGDDHVVQVNITAADQVTVVKHGSGYLIDEQTVITAAHLVYD